MIARLGYLWAQFRHAWPKRHKSSAPRVLRALAVLGERPELPPGSSVLCLGPRHVDELQTLERHRRWFVNGIDLFPTHPRIRRGDMERLPYADRAFDLIYAAHVLEHAQHVDRAAREIARVSRRYMWIEVPRGFEPNAHDRHRFDSLDDVLRPFRAAGVCLSVVVAETRPTFVCALLDLAEPQ